MPTPHYGQPRYRVIADKLRERIEGGVIPPGALLPTEIVLTAEFQASRGTIRQAIAVLRDERLVITEHGRGTYANPRRHESGPDAHVRHATSLPSPETGRPKRSQAHAALAELFGVAQGAPLVHFDAVTLVEGAVSSVVRTYYLDSGTN